MLRTSGRNRTWLANVLVAALPFWAILSTCAFAGEPDPKTYWDVSDIRPGMKGTGRR